MKNVALFRLKLSIFFTVAYSIGFSQTVVTQKKDSLLISFEGSTIFKGLLSSQNSKKYNVVHQGRTIDGASIELITISSGLSKTFELNGEIISNDNAIAVESDPGDNGLKVIRHSVGPSQSLLNNAVYDR